VLQQQAKALGVDDKVHFDGALQHSQVGEWLDQLDMFVLACKIDANGDMDGIPVVLMEAMSQSVPVVTTNLSGIPELVIPDVTGYLAEQGDAQSLQDAVGRLLANRERLEEITARALQHVADEFSLESNVDRLVVEFNRSQVQGVK
jgi:glycosyltransferase involved in cell wall biosynthesis